MWEICQGIEVLAVSYPPAHMHFILIVNCHSTTPSPNQTSSPASYSVHRRVHQPKMIRWGCLWKDCNHRSGLVLLAWNGYVLIFSVNLNLWLISYSRWNGTHLWHIGIDLTSAHDCIWLKALIFKIDKRGYIRSLTIAIGDTLLFTRVTLY